MCLKQSLFIVLAEEVGDEGHCLLVDFVRRLDCVDYHISSTGAGGVVEFARSYCLWNPSGLASDDKVNIGFVFVIVHQLVSCRNNEKNGLGTSHIREIARCAGR